MWGEKKKKKKPYLPHCLKKPPDCLNFHGSRKINRFSLPIKNKFPAYMEQQHLCADKAFMKHRNFGQQKKQLLVLCLYYLFLHKFLDVWKGTHRILRLCFIKFHKQSER